MSSISVELCGLKLKNPTILAAGLLGTRTSSLRRAVEGGAGAVTIKSISLDQRTGHHNPVFIEIESGWMNAVGYSNPGVEKAKEEFEGIDKLGVPVIGSITAGKPEEFALLAEKTKGYGFDAIEAVISCPHTPGFGMLAGLNTPEAAADVTKAVKKKTKLPVFVKLSPSILGIGEVAKAAEKAGADAITSGNTMGPGMAIDVNTGKPILDFKMGGVSGPALRPIAVRCVYDIYMAVKIPIIGVGGVASGKDALEMMMAGASAVGIGTGICYRGINVFSQVCGEIAPWLEKQGYKSIKEIVGLAHK
jgi:dihydroorotate dehydrogenase (NAD+) catalytic subunit